MVLDDKSKWLALVSWQRVFIWNIEEQQWAGARSVDLGGHRPEAVFFVSKGPDAAPSLVLVRRNGLGLEMEVEAEESRDFVICKTPLVWTVSFPEKCKLQTQLALGGSGSLTMSAGYSQQQQTPSTAIFTVTRKGCILLVRQQDDEWVSTEVQLGAEREARDIHCLLPIPALSMYLIGRSRSVDLVDIDSSAIVHTFHTELMQPRSLKQISLTRPQQSGLASITLSYISAETGDLTIHTYLPETDTDTFPVSPIEPIPSGPHSPWSRTNETINYIPNPGVWEALPSGNIVGVRKKQTTPPSSLSTSTSTSSLSTPHLAGLRRRTASPPSPDPHHHHSSGTTPTPETTPHWEAYTLNLRPDHTTTTTLSHSSTNSASSPKPTFETRPLDDAPSSIAISTNPVYPAS
jgi:hypothetical protein